MDIFDFMIFTSVIVILFVGYVLFVSQKQFRESTGHYMVPDWNFLLKKWWAEWKIRKLKAEQYEQLQQQTKNYQSEDLKQLENENSCESQLIYGTDMEGNSILIKITRRRHRLSEVWLILKLKNDVTYTLPNHPDTRFVNTNSKYFDAGGLKLECIVPYSRWRISFNGQLRLGVRTKYSNEINEEELKFVQFNFIWASCSDPIHWPYGWSPKLMATAIACEPWRDGHWMHMVNKYNSGGYDQFGALYGQLFIQSEGNVEMFNPKMEKIELNLPGLRQRRWGPHKVAHLHRTGSIIGVCCDGSVFCLGAYSAKMGLTHSQFGNIRIPNGNVYPIDWMDFHLASFAEVSFELPESKIIKFSANRTTYTVNVHLQNTENVILLGGRPFDWATFNIPVRFGLNGGRGHGISMLWYPYNSDDVFRDSEHIKRLYYPDIAPLKSKLVFSLDSQEAQSKKISGVKGASLAILKSLADNKIFELGPNFPNFEVPHGFVLSQSALKIQIERNPEIKDVLNNMIEICHLRKEGNLEEACKKVQSAILSCDIEPEIKVSIDAELMTYDLIQPDFAIRSSCILENGSEVSLAGQFETILGVKNLTEILNGIKACWASVYSIQSVTYRKEHIQPISSGMSVVIQAMINSKKSGVLFTQDPITKNACYSVITGNYGNKPETFVIRRKFNDRGFHVLNVGIGQSTIRNVEVMKLADLGVKLEKMFTMPLDIEWAIDGDHIFILQARPIIAMKEISDWELIHEFDSPIMSVDDFGINLGELFPGAVTPLTYSITTKNLDKCMTKSVGKKNSGLYSRSVVLKQYHLYYDLYSVFLSRSSGEFSKSINLNIYLQFGNEFLTKNILKVAKHRYGKMSMVQKTKHILNIAGAVWFNEKRFMEFFDFLRQYIGRYFLDNLVKFRSAKDLFNDLQIMLDKVFDVFDKHMSISSVAAFTLLLTLLVMIEGKDELTDEVKSDILTVLGGCVDPEAAQIPNSLNKITKQIFETGESINFVNLEPDASEKWLETNYPDIFKIFEEFITKNYFHALREREIMSTTWGMQQTTVIKILQMSLTNYNPLKSPIFDETQQNVMDIVNKLETVKKPATKKFLSKLLPLYRKTVERRELSRINVMAFYHELRIAFNYLGKLMTEEDLLPNQNLIHFLTNDEIRQVFKTRCSNLIKKAKRRQQLYGAWNRQPYQVFFKGVAEIEIADNVFMNMVVGIPVTSQMCTGRACVVTSNEDVANILPGDILITYSVDLGFLMYFNVLRGIVTEYGGLTSTGAIVAREYGIPCIIGAQGVLKLVKTGDCVKINGKDGSLIKVSD